MKEKNSKTGTNPTAPGSEIPELQEFDPRQVKEFINNRLTPSNREKTSALLNLLKNNKQLADLVKNPLLLATVVSLLEEEDHLLLQKPARLYRHLVDTLLEKGNTGKPLKNHFPADKKILILKKLAFRNHCRQRRTISKKEIIEEIDRYSFLTGIKKEESGLLFQEIEQQNHILKQLFMDTYRFHNISLQEYFCALELAGQDDAIATLKPHFSESWWEGAVLLFAGLSGDALPLIEAIRARTPEDIFHSNLFLTGKCIAYAELPEPFLKEQITHELWQLYTGGEFQLLKEKAASLIAQLRPRSLFTELVEQLTDPGHQVRRFAVETLGFIGDDEVLAPLTMILLKDSEIDIRCSAAAALGHMGSSEALFPLVHALETDKESRVRSSAAEALGTIENPAALPALLQVLTSDQEKTVRCGAAEAVGKIGSSEPIPRLIQALHSETESSVRWRIAMALGKLQGGESRGVLINALAGDKDKEVRESAAESLGQIGGPGCLTALMDALAFDKEADVRGSAAYALGLIENTEALPALIRTLISDSSGEVRGRAAFALGRIKNQAAVPFLAAAFKLQKESLIRGNAAYALGQIGGAEAVPFLLKALTGDKDSYVRYRAAEMLGSVGGIPTIPPLKKALRDDGSYYGWKVKDKAFEALEKISRRFHVRITWTANIGE